MQQEKWYIKYTPEITEEVFNKLLQSIKNLGLTFIAHMTYMPLTFEAFKESGYIRTNLEAETSPYFCVDNNRQQITTEKFPKDFIKPNLILGKFNIGDVVVSLSNVSGYRKEGDIFTILSKSTEDKLYYTTNTQSNKPADWRLATSEEKVAYESGIKNISDMKPKLVFKVKDWVEILSSGFNLGGTGLLQNVGDIKQISSLEQETSTEFKVFFTDGSKGRISTDKNHACWVAKYIKLSQPKSEDLTGRYFKVIKDRPNGCSIKIGEIGIVARTYPDLRIDFLSQRNCLFSAETIPGNIELMPVGFTPDKPKEPLNVSDYEEVKNLKEGNYYVQEYSRDIHYIFRYGTYKGIKIQSNTYFSDWGSNSYRGNIRHATKEEADWLSKCIAVNRFVPRYEDIKPREILNGRYYHITTETNKFIIKCTEAYKRIGGSGQDIHMAYFLNVTTSKYQNFTEVSHNATGWSFREATESEMGWLDRCIAANQFVPKAVKIDPMQEILEQAKKDYPIGTKFKAARGSRDEYTVLPSDNFYIDGEAICIRTLGNGTIYFKGNWAVKIEEPASKVTDSDALLEEAARRYPLGTEYYQMFDTGEVLSIKVKSRKTPNWIIKGNEMEVGDGYCYVRGKWAPLVEEKKEPSLPAETPKPQSISGEYIPKVGDIVEITESYNSWNSDMTKYIGQKVVVTEVYDHPYGKCIHFKDDGGWYWRFKDGHFKPVSTDIPVEILETCWNKELVQEIKQFKKYQFNEQEYLNKDFNKPIILTIKKQKKWKNKHSFNV